MLGLHTELTKISEPNLDEDELITVKKIKFRKLLNMIHIMVSNLWFIYNLCSYACICCKEKTDMNAIILAAGKGTRLRPETISIPKCMVKLFDKSLLEMQIDVFKKCSINDISIVTGYLADKITFPSINYFKNENYSSTAGNESIFCAKEKLQDCTIITYGDLVFEKAVIDQVIDFKGDIGIAVELDWETTL